MTIKEVEGVISKDESCTVPIYCMSKKYLEALDYVMKKTGCEYEVAKSYIDEFKVIVETRDSRPQVPESPKVECPYCHSTNTKKITTTSKVVNTAVWGIFGTKRHKEWHCNSCKSDF